MRNVRLFIGMSAAVFVTSGVANSARAGEAPRNLAADAKVGPLSTESPAAGWVVVAPNAALAPRFEVIEGQAGASRLVVSGNGRAECFGYLKRPVKLAAGKAYRLRVRFSFEGFDDVNRHLVHAVHGSNFNDGVWTYRREGEWIVGENSFAGPDKDMDAEIRLYFRYTARGRVVWDAVELEEREPLPARPVKIAVGWGAHDLAHWEKFLDAAGEADADIALLPEFFNAALEEKPAEPLDGPAAQFMSTKARQWKMYVAGAFKRSDGDLVFNSCPLFDREGKLVGVYDKNMLYDPELEGGLTPGVGYPVFDADFGKVGIITCYDSWFPEPSRLLGYKGAELALLPNAGYDREIMPARAADNGLVFAVSSTYSPAGIWDSGGGQAGEAKAEETRHAPAGAILSYEKRDELGLILATVDLSKKPSPHYWGGPMLSAPAARRVRQTWRVPLEKEIEREARRWWEEDSVAREAREETSLATE